MKRIIITVLTIVCITMSSMPAYAATSTKNPNSNWFSNWNNCNTTFFSIWSKYSIVTHPLSADTATIITPTKECSFDNHSICHIERWQGYYRATCDCCGETLVYEKREDGSYHQIETNGDPQAPGIRDDY